MDSLQQRQESTLNQIESFRLSNGRVREEPQTGDKKTNGQQMEVKKATLQRSKSDSLQNRRKSTVEIGNNNNPSNGGPVKQPIQRRGSQLWQDVMSKITTRQRNFNSLSSDHGIGTINEDESESHEEKMEIEKPVIRSKCSSTFQKAFEETIENRK